MAALDWTTTQTALDAAIGAADGADLTLLADVRLRLNAAGTRYDAAWSATSGVDAAKTAANAEHTNALTDWTAAYGAVHADADRAARHAENLQLNAQLATPTPYVATAGGATFVLAPTSGGAIAVAADETPIATAARVLVKGSDNALRIEAKEAGTPGNRIEVRIDAATSGTSTLCKLRVRLGSYEEAFDEIDPAEGVTVSSSLLIASAGFIESRRPDNTGAWLALTGGTGGSFAAVTARIDRAKQLPAAADQVAALDAYRAQLVASYRAKPTFTATGSDAYRRRRQVRAPGRDGRLLVEHPSVRDLEDEVQALIDEATALLAAATY